MRNSITTGLLIATLAFTSACSNTNPPLTGPARDPIKAIPRDKVQLTENGLSVPYDPRVDILLVLDDSGSMENHLSNLSSNIKQFINEFAKTKGVDFHIGFTFVHDRTRYDSGIVPQVCEPTGKTLWSLPGTLQPLVGFSKGRRYLTQEDSAELVEVLTNSLDPKIKDSPLIKTFSHGPTDVVNQPFKMPCAQGAQAEESFTPILASLENGELSKDTTSPNAGFRRPGAFFVAIIVSDAKDALVGLPADKGGLTERQVYDRIAAATGSDLESGDQRFRVFSVAIKPGTQLSSAVCKPDPAFNTPDPVDPNRSRLVPHIVEEDENPLAILAQMTADSGQDQVLSICDSSYGKKLAEYGRQVKEDALPNVRIDLNLLSAGSDDPDKKLKVTVGGDQLEYDRQWYYNNDNSITVIGRNIDWSKYVDNNAIVVDRVPVDLTEETTKPAQ